MRLAWLDPLAVLVLLGLLGAGAIWWTQARGFTLYYGDAQAHLVNARRMIDSRTPGWDQLGTVWLPMPHWLMLPFAGNDEEDSCTSRRGSGEKKWRSTFITSAVWQHARRQQLADRRIILGGAA